MSSNRDSQRNNKANKAVQAYLFGKLTHDIVESIRDTRITNDNDSTQSNIKDELLQLVLKTNEKMTNYFGESQSHLNKLICAKYADGQHSKISIAIANNEDMIFSVKGISPYAVTNKLLELYKCFNFIMSDGEMKLNL